MKMKDRFYSKTIGCIIAILAIVLGISSCKDDITTDDGSFALYYLSMTDIGPSMTGVIASPTYKGAAPYDFKITGVTYSNGDVSEPYTGECFTINSETGEIYINSTRDMNVGKYLLSISCQAAGTLYNFPNVVEVNFLKSVPEGIIVEPNFMEVKLADVNNKKSEAVFPTAKVTTENTAEHITITGYKLSNVVRLESDGSETVINNNKIELFSISDNGVISINKTKEEGGYDANIVKAGLYRIDLKLNTMASPTLGEEEGLFVDAIRINLSGAPTAISYEEGAIETGVENDPDKPRGDFKSSRPLIVGSPINAFYEITAIMKSSGGTLTDAPDEEKAFFSIDAATGVVSVPNTHTFINGDVYKVYVKVTNPEGYCISTGDNALTVNVVEWVDPLVDFTYDKNEMLQGMNFESGKAKYDAADSYVKYSFKSLPEGYEDYFSINAQTGEVKIEKYNTLPRTEEGKPFIVEVKAKNFKNEVTGKLEINVKENPNYFQFVSYGNNISDDKTPLGIYDNQYRFRAADEMQDVTLEPSLIGASDNENLSWKILKQEQIKNAVIDSNTGNITLKTSGWKANQTGYIIVELTKGVATESFSRKIPVFFHFSTKVSDVSVEYTPFVLHVNPKDGGRSVTPKIENGNNFLIDYRRTFQYYNINGVRNDGRELESGASDVSAFLSHLWLNYNKESGSSSPNNKTYRKPVSYFDNKNKLYLPLAYVDNASGENQYSVVVNPRKWYDDGWADGIFRGQMTFVTDGNIDYVGNSNNPNKIFSLVIWLDKNFDPNK